MASLPTPTGYKSWHGHGQTVLGQSKDDLTNFGVTIHGDGKISFYVLVIFQRVFDLYDPQVISLTIINTTYCYMLLIINQFGNISTMANLLLLL